MESDETLGIPTYVSLCSGYDGIGRGLERVIPNLRTIAHCEIEAYAIAGLIAKMETGQLDSCPVFSDLKRFPFRELRGRITILSAGFPCQPFSSAGKRQATEDPRHIYPWIADGISICRPRYVFLENVPGIISAQRQETGNRYSNMSSETWSKEVIHVRGESSQRMKLALLTKGKECSSLRNFPTPEAHTVEEYSLQKDGQKKTQRSRNLTAMAINGELGSWATPQASDHVEGARTAPASNQKCLGRDLNQMENWATPRAGNPGSRKPGTGGKILAEEAKKNWGTPQARDWKGAQGRAYKGGAKDLPAQTEGVPPHNGPPAPEKSNTSGKNHGSPKLDPNWVESLMLGRGMTGWTQLPTEWIVSDS